MQTLICLEWFKHIDYYYKQDKILLSPWRILKAQWSHKSGIVLVECWLFWCELLSFADISCKDVCKTVWKTQQHCLFPWNVTCVLNVIHRLCRWQWVTIIIGIFILFVVDWSHSNGDMVENMHFFLDFSHIIIRFDVSEFSGWKVLLLDLFVVKCEFCLVAHSLALSGQTCIYDSATRAVANPAKALE